MCATRRARARRSCRAYDIGCGPVRRKGGLGHRNSPATEQTNCAFYSMGELFYSMRALHITPLLLLCLGSRKKRIVVLSLRFNSNSSISRFDRYLLNSVARSEEGLFSDFKVINWTVLQSGTVFKNSGVQCKCECETVVRVFIIRTPSFFDLTISNSRNKGARTP